MTVPALWLAASLAANVVLLILVAVFALRRGSGGRSSLQSSAPGADESWETRIERLEVLWYPVIHFSAAAKRVVKTVPGVPHCKACVLPLTLKDGKGWVCPRCDNHFAESLVDVSILDMIGKQALRYFLERHKEYQAG